MRKGVWAAAGVGALLVVGLASCGPDPAEGEPGGACRFGPEACDGALVCVEGICEYPPEGGGRLRTQDLDIAISLDKGWLKADGRDETGLTFTVNRRNGGQPYDGDVLLRAEPPAGARIVPPRVTLEGGRGTATLVACDASQDRCPTSFVIHLALAERAIDLVAMSHPIHLAGVGDAEPSGGAPGPSGSTPGGSGTGSEPVGDDGAGGQIPPVCAVGEWRFYFAASIPYIESGDTTDWRGESGNRIWAGAGYSFQAETASLVSNPQRFKVVRRTDFSYAPGTAKLEACPFPTFWAIGGWVDVQLEEGEGGSLVGHLRFSALCDSGIKSAGCVRHKIR